jgi:hypothetical protein
MYAVPEPAILQSPPHFFGGWRFNCQCLIVNCQCRCHDARIVFNRRERSRGRRVTDGILKKFNLMLLLSSKCIEIFYMQGIMSETIKKYASRFQQTGAS